MTWMLKEENIGKLLNGLSDLIDENPHKSKKAWYGFKTIPFYCYFI